MADPEGTDHRASALPAVSAVAARERRPAEGRRGCPSLRGRQGGEGRGAGSARPSRTAVRSARGSAAARAPTVVYFLSGARARSPPLRPSPLALRHRPGDQSEPPSAAQGGGHLLNRSRGKQRDRPLPSA